MAHAISIYGRGGVRINYRRCSGNPAELKTYKRMAVEGTTGSGRWVGGQPWHLIGIACRRRPVEKDSWVGG